MGYKNIAPRDLILVSCPSSGFVNRQISFLLNNFIYHEGEDDTNPGLLIPRYKALGRTAPDGKVYPDKPVARESESELVRVRSIVTKKDGDLNTVTPDLIGTKFKDLTDGAAIGLSFGMSFGEGTTQSALGLKHGGHEKIIDTTGYLVAPKPCEFIEDGKWIILKVRGGELRYPRPDNLVTLNKTRFEKGEHVCIAYNTTSPMYKLNALIKLMKAKESYGTRYFEKEVVHVSDCYAYETGVIHYVEDKDGYIHVYIGDKEYQYNPTAMYYFPDGTTVNKFDRICSGVINMQHVISEVKDLNDIYLIFRKEVFTLTDKDFPKTGITDLHGTQEEIIEFLFTGLTKITYDPKTQEIEDIEYNGTQKSITRGTSFYTALSYGYGSKVVSGAVKGDVNLSGDVMTNVILGLLINDTLDKK